MRNFPGTPGTFLGLFLRMAQFTFAAGSVASMITTTRFFNLTAFCYSGGFQLYLDSLSTSMFFSRVDLGYLRLTTHLITLMGLQFIWSFTLALVDAYALVKKIFPFNPILVCRIAVGDWVTAILSLSAASASAAITVLYFHDVGHCHLGHECHKYQISVALAFMSWISTSISALIMLWLVASE
ncbi:CASP-like protein 5B3 isoform X1 [Lotus japonicus]|uniref:CASP-like protein 5B3 isoform X1 n=1 Tax=Lotus japonicus TaxID=34305 RepID=UPI00258FCA52|nr:CASP-like protein 5B3 isoform X1 [Lotus japonicus]